MQNKKWLLLNRAAIFVMNSRNSQFGKLFKCLQSRDLLTED